MDTTLLRTFLSYSRNISALRLEYERPTTDVMVGMKYSWARAKQEGILPLPFPQDAPPEGLYLWFQDTVKDWLIKEFWAPTLKIPEADFQRLFCYYLHCCRCGPGSIQ